jgi:hypothetical protein
VSEDLISVIDVASQTGERKQRIFKILKRLGIETSKMRSAANRGQLIAYITAEEFRRVCGDMKASASPDSEGREEAQTTPEVLLAEQGVFYLLMLEPDHDTGRFKLGFATDVRGRIRQLRCSAPFLKIVRTWPCKKLWERTAINCITEGCERLHTEVFRTPDLKTITARCDAFFGLMPNLPHRITRGTER